MRGPITRRLWARPEDLNAGKRVHADHSRISRGRERVAVVRIRNPARVIAKAAKGITSLRGFPRNSENSAQDFARAALEALGVLWRPRRRPRIAAKSA